MTEAEFRAIVLAYPGVEERPYYGKPTLMAYGKFFARVRAEDNSAILSEIGLDERDLLLEAEPETFHITEHYRNWPYVLARLETLDPDQLRGFLTRRWRKVAPKGASLD
ncbi:MAG: hypothetical protein JWM33_1673 [Caulobacteraceae bacterium]|nr:hypothetical protein [Caulobacteraceae bacterium]